MDYSNFNSFIVPEKKDIDIVYVIGISNESDFHPFYVGQSSRHIGRFGDYLKPNFSAATDFKVGKAIEFLTNNGFKVEFKYRNSLDRSLDEKKLINEIDPYLNKIKGYNYNLLQHDEVLKKIEEHMQEWIDIINISFDN
jgi:hypothetical protein